MVHKWSTMYKMLYIYMECDRLALGPFYYRSKNSPYGYAGRYMELSVLSMFIRLNMRALLFINFTSTVRR